MFQAIGLNLHSLNSVMNRQGAERIDLAEKRLGRK